MVNETNMEEMDDFKKAFGSGGKVMVEIVMWLLIIITVVGNALTIVAILTNKKARSCVGNR